MVRENTSYGGLSRIRGVQRPVNSLGRGGREYKTRKRNKRAVRTRFSTARPPHCGLEKPHMENATLRVIAMALLLTGCATEHVLKVPESAPQDMRVTWVRGTPEEVAFYCQSPTARLRALGGQNAVACTDALPARGSCVIYSTAEVTLATLGDEAAHCFMGAWHH